MLINLSRGGLRPSPALNKSSMKIRFLKGPDAGKIHHTLPTIGAVAIAAGVAEEVIEGKEPEVKQEKQAPETKELKLVPETKQRGRPKRK